MAVITDRLPKTNKMYISPIYGMQTQIDEKRFVESYLEKPKETLDKYGIRYDLNKMVYTFLFKYGYTVLGLRNYGRSYESETMYLSDWVFNTVKEKAVECGLTEEMVVAKFGSKTSNTYASKVCYGKLGKQGTLFGNIPDNIRSQCLNEYEFVRMMKPFEINTIYIYKDEVDKVLEVFGDDYRKVILALHMIMRAKHFQADRQMFDGVKMVVIPDRGLEDMTIIESRYWYTPCVRESSLTRVSCWRWREPYEEPTLKVNTYSKYLKHELGVEWQISNGTDRKSVITLYNEVFDTMVELGLFNNNDDDFNGGIKGYDGVDKYVDEDKAKKICLARTFAKDQPTKCYRPTFLTLVKDEVPAIAITYEDYDNGYIFNFLEYLCSIKHESVKPFNKCKIVKCKECGKRFGVLYDGRSKGRTPTTCTACGSPKAKMARSRAKGEK